MASPEPLFSPSFLRGFRRLVLAALILWCVATSLVFVDETEFVIVETLGRISAVYDHVTPTTSDRGLHVKWPWPIGVARRFDRRGQLCDFAGREMFTRDKKNVTVTTWLLWRIPPTTDPALPVDDRPVVRFFRGLADRTTAEARLEARTRALLAIEMSRVDLADLLTAATPEAAPTGASPLASLAGRVLTAVRGAPVEPAAVDNADAALPDPVSIDPGYTARIGLEILDLGIHRLNLPEGNRYAVYERMRTERERMAERYRAAGRAEKARLESLSQRQADELLARASTEAEKIRAAGEAEAFTILQQAWQRDPELYEFQRTLTAYGQILNDRTTLILSTSNRVLKLLTEGPAPKAAPPASSAPPPASP
jgi:membrane protease subunit HflC